MVPGDRALPNGWRFAVVSALWMVAAGPGPASAQDAAAGAGAYVVSVDSGMTRVRVRAELPVADSRLFMDSIQAQQLPRGWATHVRQLTATDTTGRPLQVIEAGGATWRLADTLARRVRIEYQIDLAFARAPWPAGNEQAAWVAEDALYMATKSLFVTTGAAGGVTVTFEIPRGWRVSSPWEPVNASTRTFAVANSSELLRNALVLGTHAEIRRTLGDFDLTLALPGTIAAGRRQLVPVVDAALRQFMTMFPRTRPTRFLMTVFRGPDDGEAFLRSATFTTADSITPGSALIWANFVTHELFHHWNGQQIRGEGPNPLWQWFSEGVTEYIANLTLVRTGIVDEPAFMKKVERHLGNYLFFESSPLFPDTLSLAGAGGQKTRNRFAVYDGGWTAALCADGLIREESGGTHRLEDLLRLLHEEHALTGIPWNETTLAALGRRLGSPSLGPFIAAHALKRGAMPVAACLRRMGYTAASKPYGAEVYASPLAGAHGTAARLRWLSR
jgi:predicted metalloprotease with PDZ domain